MLTEGIREVDFQVDNDEGLDALELRGKIQYVQKLEAARAALQTLSESLDAAPKSERVVSFDTEWPVFDGGHRRGAISVISLASPVSDDVVVIHLARIMSNATLLGQLKSFFSRNDLVFVGRMIKNDFAKYNKDFPVHAVTVSNVIDVGTMAVHRGVTTRKIGLTGLQALSKMTLNKFLPKPQHIRVGEVFDSPNAFSNEVQMYCARDAEAGMLLYQQYIKLPDLTA
jgi:hypothetical protein